jgi:hypothetical protein
MLNSLQVNLAPPKLINAVFSGNLPAVRVRLSPRLFTFPLIFLPPLETVAKILDFPLGYASLNDRFALGFSIEKIPSTI